ncbi:MAG: Mur ligase family protein, partial [Bacteroidia bacterium]
KLVAVAKRQGPYITGDGTHTVAELIEITNRDPERGESAEHVLAPIYVDKVTEKILAEQQLHLQSVLPDNKVLYLKDTANISSGGTAEDVTDLVHPENKFMAERIATLFKLDICGVDIMTDSVAEPVRPGTGAVIEVNAGPGLRMHSNPQKGKPRNVAAPIIDMLFRDTAAATIPVIAVTGTNGKTTTTRLIAHMEKHAGFTPGYTTTDGIYINGHLTFEGDCTGFYSTQDVLFDPSIDLAVVECARGGILKHGLGFEQCDISITTNITEDHLGLRDIHTLADLIEVKSVVARSTSPKGYAILNADDEGVYNLHKKLRCKMALFGMDITNEHIQSHIKSGGMAAVYEEEQIVIYINGIRSILENISNIPLSFGGRAEFMIKNILAAVLAGTIQGFAREAMLNALHSFLPSPEMTPGRMNSYGFDGFTLMVDYVHNKDGFAQLKKFMDKTSASEKTGIIAVAGDRRDEDIISIGRSAGQMFDSIVIRQDKHLRDRSGEEIDRLLMQGIREVNSTIPVSIIHDEKQAIEHAIRHAPKDAFIFLCADVVADSIKLVEEIRSRHKQTVNSQ